jgi:hypothetical protein
MLRMNMTPFLMAKYLRLPLFSFYFFIALLPFSPSYAAWVGIVAIPALALGASMRCRQCKASYYYKERGWKRQEANIDYSFKPHRRCRKCGADLGRRFREDGDTTFDGNSG